MFVETFSIKWFTFYYLVLGLLFLAAGVTWMVAPECFKNYLLDRAGDEHPPLVIRTVLKYFFLFTIPCLILSFMPFSWIELIFSLWSLFLVYLTGVQLVRWRHTRHLIVENRQKLDFLIRTAGAIMMALAFVIFLLSYLVIKRSEVL